MGAESNYKRWLHAVTAEVAAVAVSFAYICNKYTAKW
jgi:hypothetical protein